MSPELLRTLQTLGLLTVSNTFMTIAWYGHLKHKNYPLWLAILMSWGIALIEYIFQVPANRIGSGQFTLTQLKVMQECLALVVFVIYALLAFKEVPRWNTIISMLLVVAAVFFAFLGSNPQPKTTETPSVPLSTEEKGTKVGTP